jgi:hypothetical protein
MKKRKGKSNMGTMTVNGGVGLQVNMSVGRIQKTKEGNTIGTKHVEVTINGKQRPRKVYFIVVDGLEYYETYRSLAPITNAKYKSLAEFERNLTVPARTKLCVAVTELTEEEKLGRLLFSFLPEKMLKKPVNEIRTTLKTFIQGGLKNAMDKVKEAKKKKKNPKLLNVKEKLIKEIKQLERQIARNDAKIAKMEAEYAQMKQQ